ncbi:MAG: DUF1080 domain-containing protein [Isosphaeraceae bacterium]
MNRRSLLRAGLGLGLAGTWTAHAPLAWAAADEEGFRPLFNGKDLEGWVPVNVAPETFTVKDGLIVSTGVPTGVLRTDRHYENFVIELEWRHMKPKGNAGLFIWSDALPAPGVPFTRGIEVQILDGRETANYTSHGDVFAIHGATLTPDHPHPAGWPRALPTEKRAKASPEWNHYRVECRDGRIALAVNGKVVSTGHGCNPRKGYICLEAEGSECHFRNIRIKELPSSNPSDDQIATLDSGLVSLYSGLDLRGWKHEPGHVGHWAAKNWKLTYDGKSTAKDKSLWTEADYGDFEMIVDWRLPGKPVPRPRAVILPSGDDVRNPDGTVKNQVIPYAGDSGILIRGSEKAQLNITCNTVGSGELYGYRTDRSMPPEVRAASVPKVKADRPPGQWNRFHITLRGEHLVVRLNDQLVIDQARLPGLPRTGPIGLQHHGDPLEFANLFIKKLG